MLCGSDYQTGDYKTVMFPDLMGEENNRIICREFAHLLGLPYLESQLLKVHDSSNQGLRVGKTKSLPSETTWSPMHFAEIGEEVGAAAPSREAEKNAKKKKKPTYQPG